MGKETEDTINQWKKDFKNYNTLFEHNLGDFASQSIENDATEFAWNFISNYINEDKEIS